MQRCPGVAQEYSVRLDVLAQDAERFDWCSEFGIVFTF
jgi:hypothetical protein